MIDLICQVHRLHIKEFEKSLNRFPSFGIGSRTSGSNYPIFKPNIIPFSYSPDIYDIQAFVLHMYYKYKVAPLDNIEILKYLFSSFDLDVSSDTLENDFTDALKEELDVAEKLPGAIEKAKKEGVFD